MPEKKVEKKKKDIEVVTGKGENLEISPVYDHIKIDKPSNSTDKDKKIIIPKSKKQ